jgi:hypothetical protein
MKDGLILQKDIHVKAMNKLVTKFTTDHCKIYNGGDIVVSCKIKVKRVRKYFYNYLLNPPDKIKAIYEVDIIVSDLVYTNVDGRTRDPKLFILNNKRSYNRGLKLWGIDKIVKYINMIDSDPMSIVISKIEYNL